MLSGSFRGQSGKDNLCQPLKLLTEQPLHRGLTGAWRRTEGSFGFMPLLKCYPQTTKSCQVMKK